MTNSRLQKRQNTVWRRRACETCKNVFSTREHPLHAGSVLVRGSQNKKLQPFQRDTLFLSIYEVCKHRPQAIKEAGALVETTMAMAFKSLENGVVERNSLAGAAHTVLTRFDDTAANLYAAYHPLAPETTK